MATTPRGIVTVSKSKQIKATNGGGGGVSSSGGGGIVNNSLKKGSLLYIPRQVLMNDTTTIKAPASRPSKHNICSTEPSSVSKMNQKMLNIENPKSCIDQNWSPIMDGIVTSVPPHLYANCSLPNGTKPSKDPKKVNVGLAMKALDRYMDKILYGSKKSSLPVFEKICCE